MTKYALTLGEQTCPAKCAWGDGAQITELRSTISTNRSKICAVVSSTSTYFGGLKFPCLQTCFVSSASRVGAKLRNFETQLTQIELKFVPLPLSSLPIGGWGRGEDMEPSIPTFWGNLLDRSIQTQLLRFVGSSIWMWSTVLWSSGQCQW